MWRRGSFILVIVLCAASGLRAFSTWGHTLSIEVQLQKAGFQKYVDEVPRLTSIKVPLSARPHTPFDLDIHLRQMKVKIHRDLPEALAWGYEGLTPGPMIEVQSGQALRVHWKNDLPLQHILPAATGMDMSTTVPLPDVRTVTHLHGASVEQASQTDSVHNNDGWPDAFTVPGQEQISLYPNQVSARTLFFHDHAIGTTGRNVAAGLMGLYLIHDDYERSLNLPSGPYEITLALQAKGLNADGSMYYVADLNNEHYGNVVAVNGKIWPYMNVEPRKYRLRLVNISNARSYDMKFVDVGDQSAGPAIAQIGSDGGFLDKIAEPDLLRLAPAERADIIVDFSKYAGHDFFLYNTNHDAADGELPIPELMKFKVAAVVSSPDTSSLPLRLKPIPRIDPRTAVISRQIVLSSPDIGGGRQISLLNGKLWHDPITERAQLGTVEIWKLMNTTSDTHPFHVHLVEFQVLDRTPFDAAEYLKSGNFVVTGPAVPPDDNETGWKDVIRTPPSVVTRIIMKFNTYAGFYVYHCHILEHEDMDMMRPFEVYRPVAPAALPVVE